MCVIAYKAKNVRFPSEQNVREMWERNPDGAGIMWRDDVTNKIRFVKGFMKLKKFEKWIKENKAWLEEVECALHFRITTHGGTSAGNCHPFVISEFVDSHLIQGEADEVLMHNGILSITPRSKDISDSAELALRLGKYDHPSDVLARFNEMLTGNRIIIMGKDGTHFFGDPFKKSFDDNGILYSNLHWETSWYLDKPIKPIQTVWTTNPDFPTTPRQCRFDYVRGEWIDLQSGEPIDIYDVDPDCLSEDDFDEYECQMNGYYDDYMTEYEEQEKLRFCCA